jgi:hypothetical protein
MKQTSLFAGVAAPRTLGGGELKGKLTSLAVRQEGMEGERSISIETHMYISANGANGFSSASRENT